MKNSLVWLFVSAVLFSVVGCNGQRSPAPPVARPKPSYRSSVELGMNLAEVWMAANKPRGDLINESLSNGCKEQVYRFWFDHTYRSNATVTKYNPYLLTFRKCDIADDDAVTTERKRRTDAWAASNPDAAKVLEEFCQEQGFSQTSKEVLIEVLGFDIYSGLPNPGAGYVLVKIEEDTNTIMLEGVNRPQLQTMNQNLEATQQQEDVLKANAYGPGIHRNRYGQPVTLRPDWGGVPGEKLIIKPDAYGLGVHSDQYGRPVREHPWP